MELTRLQGRQVIDGDGRRVGSVADLGVSLADDPPSVTHLVVRLGRSSSSVLPWSQVRRIDEDRIQLDESAVLGHAAVPDEILLLGRDVLDCQVFDAAGARLARVADVRLEPHGDGVRVVGVEVGAGAVLRRLGLARLGRRWREDPIDWRDLHLASARGHALMLRSPQVRRLTPPALAELLGHLPTDRGADLLQELPPHVAADALSRARPRLGGRLVKAIAPRRAGPIIHAMEGDDATAALRHLSPAERDDVLAHVDSVRASQLRRLLAHPVQSAGGLMNPDVIAVPATASVEEIRAAVAAHPPRLDALSTAFLIDSDGRPVGSVSPVGLVAGDAAPVRGPIVHEQDPVADVVDIFALNDVMAIAVVDADGRLVGAIGVDDVLEELLAERLPGRRRYRGIRHRWRR